MGEAGADACGAVFGGRYRIERTLKSGNGVDTCLARDLDTEAAVVLKSIDPAVVPTAARLRFQHETLVLRELSGTGLPGLLDAGFADERLYLVQPFVEGVTLEAMLRDGPLPLLTTLRLRCRGHGPGRCRRRFRS